MGPVMAQTTRIRQAMTKAQTLPTQRVTHWVKRSGQVRQCRAGVASALAGAQPRRVAPVRPTQPVTVWANRLGQLTYGSGREVGGFVDMECLFRSGAGTKEDARKRCAALTPVE